MKKYRFIIVLLIVLALSGLALFGGRHWQQQRFNKEFKELNMAIITDIPTINAIGQRATQAFESELIFFSQSDETSSIRQQVDSYIDNIKPQRQSLINQEWLVIYPQTSKSKLENVLAYDLMQRTYRTKGLDVQLSDEQTVKQFYAKSDGSPFTLNDLIKDKAGFRQQLDNLLYKSEEPQAKAARTDLLAQFETDDWSAISFTVEGYNLLLDKAILSLSPFLHYLNTSYFSEQELQQLQELETSRQLMEDAEDTVTIQYN
ncbi:hypothetical protein ACVRZR_02815 [Streptococcus entericus]|uniref:hypothetical protein n=1 Tax=Streptococcus entericus TaxID=155680 RepID=UPI000382A110|nr:hypothetical protein [Streptococcus entericus]